MRFRPIVLALALAGTAAVARGEEIDVFAAASLTDALTDIGRLYEATSADKVVFNFGASSDLARQIQEGAPADVFFSADTAQMDRLEKAGLVRAGSRSDVLTNVLVVVVPSDSKAEIRGPSDLERLGRIAVADPEAVPAGVYARTYLEGLGLWSRLKEKAVPTLNVRAVLASVESGNADAGFVYRTDAAVSKRARVAFEVPAGTGPKIVFPMAPVVASRKAGVAAVVKFLTSPAAREVYVRRGFGVIAPSAAP